MPVAHHPVPGISHQPLPGPEPGGSQALPTDSSPGSVPNVCHLGKEDPLPKTLLGTLSGRYSQWVPDRSIINFLLWADEGPGLLQLYFLSHNLIYIILFD